MINDKDSPRWNDKENKQEIGTTREEHQQTQRSQGHQLDKVNRKTPKRQVEDGKKKMEVKKSMDSKHQTNIVPADNAKE